MSSSWKMARSKKRATKLDKVLSQTVRNKGWQREIANAFTINSWNRKNVGKGIFANSQAYHIEAGKLYVLVSSSTWMNELSFLKPRIINNINQAVGKDLVKDIQFKIGNVKGYRKRQSRTNEWEKMMRPKKREGKKTKVGRIRQENEETTLDSINEIDEAVDEIKDPQLREIFRRIWVLRSKSAE